MQTVEARKEGMGVVDDVLVIVFEDRPEEFVFRVGDGFDDEAIVAGKVEEGAGFAGRAELRKNVFGSEGEEVVGGVEVEVLLAQITEDPGSVVFEFKVVPRGRSEFVPDTIISADRTKNSHVKGVFMTSEIVLVGERTADLGLRTRYLISIAVTA